MNDQEKEKKKKRKRKEKRKKKEKGKEKRSVNGFSVIINVFFCATVFLYVLCATISVL